MRVLHVVDGDQRRGAEIFAGDLVRALEADVSAQHVAVLRPMASRPVEFLAPVTRLDGGLFGAGARVRRLARLLATWRPDVIQVHGGDALRPLVAARRPGGIPLVLRHIGMAAPKATFGVRRHAYRLLFRRADRHIAVSDAVRRQVIRIFAVPPQRVLTIPNAVDPERLRPHRDRVGVRAALGIPADALVLLSVGALVPEKDPAALVRIGAHLLRRDPRAFHLIVGDGPVRAEVQRVAAAQGLDGRLLILGARSDVADLLAAGDVLLLASSQDGMEGMPGIAIEAGLAGIPVAGYAVAGLPEVIVDGVTGMLTRPGEELALAETTAALMFDADMRKRLGAAARERCRARFDIRSASNAYLGLYRSVLEE